MLCFLKNKTLRTYKGIIYSLKQKKKSLFTSISEKTKHYWFMEALEISQLLV